MKKRIIKIEYIEGKGLRFEVQDGPKGYLKDALTLADLVHEFAPCFVDNLKG